MQHEVGILILSKERKLKSFVGYYSEYNEIYFYLSSIIKAKKMKNILYIVIIALSGNLINAQSLIVEDKSGTDISKSEIIVNGDPNDFELISHPYVRNISGTSYVVNAKRIELTVDCPTEHALCWDVCPAPTASCTETINVNSLSRTIPPGDVDDTGAGHLYPKGSFGVSKYRYVFYLDIDNDDSTYVDVTYNHNIVSIEEKEAFIMNFSPNPSNGEIKFTFNNSELHQVEIIDLLGKVTAKDVVINGQVLNFSDQKKGVYFVRVSDKFGRNVSTQKLILE